MELGGSALPLGFPAVDTAAYLLVAVRLMAALTTALAFGRGVVPVPVRLGFALLVAALLTPVVPISHLPTTTAGFVLAAGREAFIGLLEGFALQLTFFIVRVAADLIGSQMGLTIASLFDPLFAQQESVLDRFFTAVAVLVFLQVDGLQLLLIAFQGLFVALPVGDLGLSLRGIDNLVTLFENGLLDGVKLGMPVLGALLLADVGLALAARTVPQLNLFVVGIPVKLALGLFSLSLALPSLTSQIAELVRRLPADY
jgi:flagellar biosynthesis protein FliR